MHPLLTPAGQATIEATVEAIEDRSAAEVLVAVHPRSAVYRGAATLLGVIAAVVVQALLLYSEPEFPLALFIVAPLSVGLVVGLLGRLPVIERLTPRSTRARAVRLAAEAAFYRLGAGHTRDRTGVVVFFSLAERCVEVVADSGVLRQRPLEAWDAAIAALREAARRGAAVDEVVAALRQLGEVLALCLPWRDDDMDELPNTAVDR